jgi:hypothetical protein
LTRSPQQAFSSPVSTFARPKSPVFGRFLLLVSLTAAVTLASAQNAPKERKRESAGAPAEKLPVDDGPANAPKERQNLGLSQISIIDKLMAAEFALGQSLKRTNEEQWASEYKALYKQYAVDANPGRLSSSRSILALALGMKASDGVLALKGRDMEALNACAEQIEKLASKLNVPSKNLQRASIIKHHALASRWAEAFMELGFLQREVSRTLEANPAQRDEALLIIIGSWLQGGRCITSLIAKNHTPASSNILREPKLIQIMASELNNVPQSYKDEPVVQEIIKFLPEVQKNVNVGLRDPIPLEVVQQMHERFTYLTGLILKSEAAKP